MNHEAFLFAAVPPCPDTIQAAGLLAEIEAVIKNLVVLPDPAAAALVVWVLGTKNDVRYRAGKQNQASQPDVLPVCCRAVAILLPLKCLPDNRVTDVATLRSAFSDVGQHERSELFVIARVLSNAPASGIAAALRRFRIRATPLFLCGHLDWPNQRPGRSVADCQSNLRQFEEFCLTPAAKTRRRNRLRPRGLLLPCHQR
jgi:hypothetical protein